MPPSSRSISLWAGLALWGHIVRLAARSVLAHRLRSVLSALGVMAGVTAIVTVQGVIAGIDRAFMTYLSLMGTSTAALSHKPLVEEPGKSSADWPLVRLEEARVLEERLTEARAVVPVYTMLVGETSEVQVEVGARRLFDVYVQGSTVRWPTLGSPLSAGRFFTDIESRRGRPVVVVGADILEEMQRAGLGLGDAIYLQGLPLTVVGAVERRGQGPFGSLDKFMVLPTGVFESVFGLEVPLEVMLMAHHPRQLAEVADAAIGLMRGLRRLAPGRDNNFALTLPEQGLQMYRELTGMLYAVTTALGLIALLISGGGIMNIMLVTVAERTREVGVLCALGARTSTILGQFLLEAALLSGMGGVAGVFLGSLIIRAVATWTPVAARVTPTILVVGLGYGLFTGLLFALLPALRAARLLPATALRAP